MPLLPWHNPLVIAGVRRRLRPKAAVTVAVITAVISFFVYGIVYLVATEREITSSVIAARWAFTPIYYMQLFFLLFLGTGAIASGVAENRLEGHMDYQRMTPMSPADKTIGYLLGLSIREHFMFAVTLPFALYAVVAGEMPFLEVLEMYLFLFLTVTLYHLTGFVAGLLAKNPRRAGMTARFIIIVLYFVLPGIGKLGGASLFGHFTADTALQTLLGPELAMASPQSEMFFGIPVPLLLITLCVQSMFIFVLFTATTRKWRNERLHAISKPMATLLFGTLLVLIVGSLWSQVGHEIAFLDMETEGENSAVAASTIMVFSMFFLFSFGMCAFLCMSTTPDKANAIKGARRAARNNKRLHFTSDEASSQWLVVFYAMFTGIALIGLFEIGSESFSSSAVGAESLLLPWFIFASVLAWWQGLRELLEPRLFWLSIGVLWVVPIMASIVVVAAWDSVEAASYLSLTTGFPATAISLTQTFADAFSLDPSEVEELQLPSTFVVYLSAFINGALALAVSVTLWRRRQS
ncbi:MAG: hypothetical protein JKY56_22205 [Kofleriaceae bacterium]|nr:hypothetical protein [Kofleriaceae bacterium]